MAARLAAVRTIDLAVVGGGPAGAAAALGAARAGLSVLLFEPRSKMPDKPCGEGILPAGVAVLRALGLGELVGEGLALPRIRYVFAGGRELDVPLPEPGRAIERPVLMAALERALEREPGVTRVDSTVACARGDGFELVARGRRWNARTLIAADGLQGRAASWLGRRPSRRTRYGLRARALQRERLEHVEVHLGRESEVYLTPLPGGRINVAVLADAPLGPARIWLARALTEHPRAARRLGAWVTAPAARALGAAVPSRVAAESAFLAGDATGGVDPVLGCGVGLALTTGLAAAEGARRVLAEGSGAPEREYTRFVRAETHLRRLVAGGLVFLAAHPALQGGVARLLEAMPAVTTGLAARVGGVRAARLHGNRPGPDLRMRATWPAPSSPAPCPTPTGPSTSDT